MKKNLMKTMVAVAALSLAMTSCNKSTANDEAQAQPVAPGSLKIAYVEVDSIMSQYKFCKDYSLILQKKAAAANFQQKVQQNAYTREQAEGIQAGLQKQSADLDALNRRLSNEFQAETDKYNAALRDSIQHFLAAYNKDKKYSLILSKAGDNLLYADKAYDVTAEVIAGLNKAYKPTAATKKATEEKK